MNIEAEHKEILSALMADKRPRIELSVTDIDNLNEQWTANLTSSNSSNSLLLKLLCIIDYSSNLLPNFTVNIIKTLETSASPDVLIHTLSIANKHIITYNQRKGNRVPIEFLNTLEKLLKNSDHEVVEWTLRTLEQIGMQSLILKSQILAIKPKILLFNKHKKNIHEIISLLQQRWGSL
jgi:hypothetical protein